MNSSAVNTSTAMNSSSEVLTSPDACNNSALWNFTNGLDDNDTCANSGRSTSKSQLGIPIAFLSMDVVIVAGSVVLMVLIYKATKFKDAPARLLMNNVVCDAIAGFSWLVLWMVRMFVSSHESEQTAIYVQRIIVYIIANVSFDTLLVNLFTLHLAICSPLRYKLYCRKIYVLIFLLISWAINIAIACSVLLVEGYEVANEQSLVILLNAKEYYAVFVTIELVRGLFLPVITLVVCYVRINLHVRSPENPEIFRQSTSKTYIHQAKGIFLVTITFFLSHQPVYLLEILKVAVDDSATDEQLLYYIKMGFSYLGYLYYVLKLPLFLVGFQSLRRAFMTIFCLCCCNQRTSRLTLHNGPGNDLRSSETPCEHASLPSTGSSDQDTATTTRASSEFVTDTTEERQAGVSIIYSDDFVHQDTQEVSMKTD